MHVIVLAPGPWKIVAELDERDDKKCSVLEQLNSLGPNYKRSLAGLVVAIKLVAKQGPVNVPWIEPASSGNPRVYKFVKGDLRLYFCYADGRILVCGSCCIKKTQKTEKLHIKNAVAVFKRYEKAVLEKTIKEIERDERQHKLQ